jgi:uncharacterized protein (TIGR02145 family)
MMPCLTDIVQKFNIVAMDQSRLLSSIRYRFLVILSFMLPLFVLGQDSVMDIDGNYYSTVEIGSQTWLQENLKVLHNPDGSPISNVYAYGNSQANADIYGRLYFWDAAMNGSTQEKAQGICPDQWHIPSKDEWVTLANYLGGMSVAGGKMKEAGTAHWYSPNTGATNSSGFTALPAGEKDHNVFQLLHEYAVIWSSTEVSQTWATYYYLSYEDQTLHPYNYHKDFAYSVRCVKDEQTGLEMENKKENILTLYPNPVKTKFNIHSGDAMTHLTVINQTGVEVHKFRVTGNSASVDLEFLPPGYYFAKIATETGSIVRPFIKN